MLLPAFFTMHWVLPHWEPGSSLCTGSFLLSEVFDRTTENQTQRASTPKYSQLTDFWLISACSEMISADPSCTIKIEAYGL